MMIEEAGAPGKRADRAHRDPPTGNLVLPTVWVQVADPESWNDLIEGLQTLGMYVKRAGRGADTDSASGPSVWIIDESVPAPDPLTAFVVVSRQRSVQGATAAIGSGASGYFAPPIDLLSLSATLSAAASKARALMSLTERTAKLSESLAADQTISTVVGMLMERYRFQRADAYERLRRYSRAERRKIIDVATRIVTASDELSQALRAIESIPADQ